jgi:anthraniloyl-CoA monooxygenase
VNVLVVGGGPGGLYAALLLKRRTPDANVTVLERNRPDDTFGWGVVLSDQTVDNLRAADPDSAEHISDSLHHWDDIEVHFGGHRAIRRTRLQWRAQRLLAILQASAAERDRAALRVDVSASPSSTRWRWSRRIW